MHVSDVLGLSGIHGVQRLDRQRHVGGASMVEQIGNTIADLRMRVGQIPRAVCQAANHQHQALSTDLSGLIDRPVIVVARGRYPGSIG